MLEMLEKQASQIKTAADQFRALARDLDKLAFKPDAVRKVEGMDKLLAVRDYNAPVYKRHRPDPGGVDELRAEDPLNTIAEVANLPSEAQEPPKAAEDGDDNRKTSKENKSLGTVGYTWTPDPKPETVPSLVSTPAPGVGAGNSEPQPRIAEKTASIVERLARSGKLQTLGR